MSLISSMYTAANGLQAHSDAMGIVSDNISNINTVGFKESTPRFVDIMAKAAGGVAGNATLGQGSQVSGTETSFAQGAMLSTGGATDLAIQGDGFFVVAGSTANGSGTFFTRAGQFQLDKNGALINKDKLAVQGYAANAQGAIGSSLGPISVPLKSLIAPLPTANMSVTANLNPTPTAVPAFNVATPSTTSHFSVSEVAFDSLGAAHPVQVYFRQNGAGSYQWFGLCDGADLAGGTPGTPVQCANGTLSFNTAGKLTAQTTASSSFNFLGATAGQVINFNLGDPIGTGGTGTQGITDYAIAMVSNSGQPVNGQVSALGSDGYASGAFEGIAIAADGTITGSYSNSNKLVLGQLAIAKFPSIQGVERIGETLFQSSADSGQAAIGSALSGGRGSITSQSLEQSNVNLSNDFIEMMAYQRGFQANSRTVHTSDSMLQELVNLGR
jgi:flagellar hook protein FlgE